MSEMKAKVVLEAIDRISSVMERMSGNFSTAIQKMNRGAAALATQMRSLGRNISEVGGWISTRISAPVAAFGGLALSKMMVFEKLNASLQTVTGSLKNAQIAMKDLVAFAGTTPFELEEVVTSFIRLKALGLDPSMDAMKAYGNVSSAMGKSMIQFIEAIADASTGEFERLKEFGIKASSEGDKVAFSFQGQTTVVKKNATDIERYLRSIGQVQFAGAMERQMQTLGGAVSNLQDAISTSMAMIGQQLSETFELKKYVTDIAAAISKMAASFSALPQPVKAAFAYSALFLAVIGPLLMIIGQMVIGIGGLVIGFKLVAPAVLAVLGVIKMLTIGLFTTPFGWFTLGVMGIIAAGWLLVKNWSNIKAFFAEFWDNLKWLFKQGVDWVLGYLEPLFNALDMVKQKFNSIGGSGGMNINSRTESVSIARGAAAQKIDTGGTLKIKVDSEGRASVSEARPNDSRSRWDVDAGFLMGGAY